MMRRFRQQLSENETLDILNRSTSGVLSLIDPDEVPYGVPMSFVFDGKESIYFHCALSGRKIECIKNSPNACFTIIDLDEIHPQEFTTYFRSVIVEGLISIVTDKNQIIESLRLLSSKYSPGIDCVQEIEKSIERVSVLKFKILTKTGKEAIELVRQKERL